MSYPAEIYQLMARYLTGESTIDESAKLEDMLVSDPNLVIEFEECKALLLDCNDDEDNSESKKHFDRISKRLKDEGLM
jgi:hypothetical protein